MKTVKQQGVGGEWTKVTITVGECVYTRNTAPNGTHQYANVSGRNSVSVRAGGKTATIIDKAIAAHTPGEKKLTQLSTMTLEARRQKDRSVVRGNALSAIENVLAFDLTVEEMRVEINRILADNYIGLSDIEKQYKAKFEA